MKTLLTGLISFVSICLTGPNLAGLTLGSLTLVNPSFATTFYAQPFPETVQQAPIIVRGKTGASYADWSKTGENKNIYTYTDLQMTEVLKGKQIGPSILIREMGGQKDGVG